MRLARKTPGSSARLATALAMLVAGCAAPSANPTLNSVHQPVVERSSHSLDLQAGPTGLAAGEAQRLEAWLASLGAGYGDRVAVTGSAADMPPSGDIASMVARYGAQLVAGEPAAGAVPANMLRVTLTRSTASLPGCSDWRSKTDLKVDNATSSNFGCAVNGNLAAMVADPEHLLHGAEDAGRTGAMTAAKAIASYRAQEPTGAGGLPEVSSKEVGE